MAFRIYMLIFRRHGSSRRSLVLRVALMLAVTQAGSTLLAVRETIRGAEWLGVAS